MIRKSTNDILIQTKVSPLVRVSRILGGILILIAIAYLSYSAGVKSGHAKFDSDRELITELNGKVGELKVELSDAGENLIIAQRHKQIQEEAYKQINAAYAGAEQKNRYLGSRLDFYRSIISPQDGQSGPAIQALEAKQQGVSVSDDAVQTACQQSCPAGAIVFGDINNPESRVSRALKDNPRAFRVLEEIDVEPSVHYLTQVRNSAEENDKGDEHHG